MTNPLVDLGTFQALARNLNATFAEIGFQVAAQGILGALLRSETDHAHARLDDFTTDQLARAHDAAQELATLTAGVLEDREVAADIDAAESEEDTEPRVGVDRSEWGSRDMAGG